MRKFLIRLVWIIVFFIGVNTLILFVVPKDENGYLCAWIDKIELLNKTQQPRIILLGGSSVAFGTDSKMMSDSLDMNVVNMGMHAGIGLRYMVEDCCQYFKSGDILVLQFEYANFINGGWGEPESFSQLMVATNFNNIKKLSLKQLLFLLTLPQLSINNLIRLFKYPYTRSFNTSSGGKNFSYTRDGFNEYGDEVSHFNYPSSTNLKVGSGKSKKVEVNEEFVKWLDWIMNDLECRGVKIFLMPPVNILSNHKVTYFPTITKALERIKRKYVTSPESMVLGDSLTFDGGYHVNREGVIRNTNRMIKLLKKEIN